MTSNMRAALLARTTVLAGMIAAIALALAGCADSADDAAARAAGGPAADGSGRRFAGLVAPPPPPPRPTMAQAASNPDALVRAARVPHHLIADQLGPHQISAQSRVVIARSGAAAPARASNDDADNNDNDNNNNDAADNNGDSLVVDTVLEYADRDRFHATVKNDAGYGREIFYIDGDLYLRPGYGVFHRRPPTQADEPAALRDQLVDEFGAHLALITRALAVKDAGAVEHHGREARRVELSLAATPTSMSPAEVAALAPAQAWRASLTVSELSGEVLIDAATAAPLEATLRAVVRFERDSEPMRMEIEVVHRIERIGDAAIAAAIAAPAADDWVATPTTSTEHSEREALLEGIAQPARPAPMPTQPPEGSR